MRIQLLVTGVLLISATACGGGGGGPTSVSAAKGTTHDPVQLTSDPCGLVTQPEAEKVLGKSLAKSPDGINGNKVCTYVGVGSTGNIAVSMEPPSFCKLLYLALDKNLFGGNQVRVDDVGDGGMQVKGNGNVQFTTHGGCVEVSGTTSSGHVDDATMLDMAKTAAGRVTG